ncbi:hypothetical protein [Kurthia massiliensis]|nr:hypothetical protein [Kurthia massiliensis]
MKEREQEQSGNMANNMEELKELGESMEEVHERANEEREEGLQRDPAQ